MNRKIRVKTAGARRLACTLGLLLCSHYNGALAAGDTLELGIQPILSEQNTRSSFQPLADYLSTTTGKKVIIRTSTNFMVYWNQIRQPKCFDLVLDAAHFTDYRIQKHGYQVLAKIPDGVSYSLIVHEDDFVFEAEELIARRIATLGTPSIGAAQLNAMFPNPVRQPIIVEVANASEGMRLLLEKKVAAAILPTPLVNQQMNNDGGISIVTTTKLVPHIAMSTAADMDPTLRDKIQQALVQASTTPEGQTMLKQLGFPQFDQAEAALYFGQAKILQKYWGY